MELKDHKEHIRNPAGCIFSAAACFMAAILIIHPASVHGGDQQYERAEICNVSGMKCLREGEYACAETFFLQAIRLNPRVKYYYNNLSVMYIRTGEYEKALRSLNTCTVMDPGYTKALANMAAASFYLYRFHDAYRYYRKALAADRIYTEKRFSQKKVLVRMKIISEKNPENRDLKRMIQKLENFPVNHDRTGK